MNQYTIKKKLGDGNQGEAFAAVRNEDGFPVVLKRLQQGAVSTSELNVMLKLRHPHIVRCLDSFHHEQSLFLVLEFLEGGDLGHYLKQNPNRDDSGGVSLAHQLHWFAQISRALQYCHENRVLHRDIKIDNIFLTSDLRKASLGDFGVAKDFGPDGKKVAVATTFVGSPVSLSPEVLSGTPYSYMSDIWSLGCVLYEIVCQRRPFESDSFAQLVNRVCSGQYAPIPSSVPTPLAEIIKDMLNIDVNERLQLPEVIAQVTDYLAAVAAEEKKAKSKSRSRSSSTSGANHHGNRSSAAATGNNNPRTSSKSKPLPPSAPPSPAEVSIDSWFKAKQHEFATLERYLAPYRVEDAALLKRRPLKQDKYNHNHPLSDGNSREPSTESERAVTPELKAGRAKRMLPSPQAKAPAPGDVGGGGGGAGRKLSQGDGVRKSVEVTPSPRQVVDPRPRCQTPPTPGSKGAHRRSHSEPEPPESAEEAAKRRQKELKQHMAAKRAEIKKGADGNKNLGGKHDFEFVMQPPKSAPATPQTDGLPGALGAPAPAKGLAKGGGKSANSSPRANQVHEVKKSDPIGGAPQLTPVPAPGAPVSGAPAPKEKKGPSHREDLRAMIKAQRDARSTGANEDPQIEIMLPSNLKKLPQNKY